MTSSTCHWDKAVRNIQSDKSHVWSKRCTASNSVASPLPKGPSEVYSALYFFGPFPPFHCRVHRIRPVLTNTAGTMSRPNCMQFVTQCLRVNLPNGHLLQSSPTTILYPFLISPIALQLQPLSFASALLKPTNYDTHSVTSLFLHCLYDQLITHLKSQY
jgi:hypothetical protein